MRNDSGPALNVDGLLAGQSVYLRGLTATGASETGAVNLIGADIGAQFDCSEASLRNDSGPALNAYRMWVGQTMNLTSEFTATGGGTNHVVLDLRGARVGGTVFFQPARLSNPASQIRPLLTAARGGRADL